MAPRVCALWRRRRSLLSLLMAAPFCVGCGDQVLFPSSPKTHPPSDVEPLGRVWREPMDLLLVVDNSRSMADKQQILASSVAEMVRSLVNPPCVDPTGSLPDTQPAQPFDACPEGQRRKVDPMRDLHIGVISSSLGGHGSDACPVTEPVGNACPDPTRPNASNDDHGHLLSRSDACGGPEVSTYRSAAGAEMGFLAWDLDRQLSPPGEGDLERLLTSVETMVKGVGEIGCGFEAPLESWYRFLVDPNPYASITLDPNKGAVPIGTDTALLAQRKAFLRPDSIVAIVMLTDENDCSVRDSGIAFYATQRHQPKDPTAPFNFPRARAECATDPSDACCRSCTALQDGCPVDPSCADPLTRYLTDKEDPMNLRCFDQKRRFGYDFLQPVERYRSAIRDNTIADRDGNMVPNPLYASDEQRPVLLTGIVGVPWQLIARDKEDLAKGFKRADELGTIEADGATTWEKILGDPTRFVAPKDPHMVESITPRAGLPPPGSEPGADPYNGHETTPNNAPGDLQYACTFKLPAPRVCTPGSEGCDCYGATSDSPLCDPEAPTRQVSGKSYPGLRELAVLKSIDYQGFVASACPAVTEDASRADYGYRPALGGLMERLLPAVDGSYCFPRPLPRLSDGTVDCVIIAGTRAPNGCTCDPAKARSQVSAAHAGVLESIRSGRIRQATGLDCFCEIDKAGDPAVSSAEELKACLNVASESPVMSGGARAGEPADGWCFIDATTNPPTGNPDLVNACAPNEKRRLRFVGRGEVSPGETTFMACDVE